jgi:hypothetical protein
MALSLKKGRNTMRKFVTFVCMTLVAMIFPASVSASTMAIQPTGGTILNTASQPQNGNGWTLGWSFRTTDALVVTDLGIYDYDQDGLGYAHQVGFWAEDNTLLGSVTVPMGTAGVLVNHFRFASLANPITLLAGSRYYVGALYLSSYTSEGTGNGLAPDAILYNVDSLNSAPGITYDLPRAAYDYSLELKFPGYWHDNYPSTGYFGPNFEFTNPNGNPTAPPVPEPETYAMLLAGLGLLGIFARCRKQQAA